MLTASTHATSLCFQWGIVIRKYYDDAIYAAYSYSVNNMKLNKVEPQRAQPQVTFFAHLQYISKYY